jgi:aldose 1-epimerase
MGVATIARMPLSRVPFGTDRDGRPAEAFVLRQAGLEAWLLEWGATLARLRVMDARGRWNDVVLGFGSLADYQQAQPYLGAVVGRHANRIRDGRFALDGREVVLACNDGAHHLHGGPEGFDRRPWTAAVLAAGDEPALEFALHSPDGDQGYPGALAARVTYRLHDGRLHIDYLAASSAPTPVNLTQHAYFDLSGRGDIRGQQLRLAASNYLPVDAQLLPTGEIREVAGTAFDFRAGAVIGERLQALHAAEPASLGFDHCFVLDGAAGALRTAADLLDPASGRRLRLLTDQPGLQVYTGNFLDGRFGDRDGMRLHRHAGLCLEPQRFPDGPNQPAFPNAVLRPGEVYRQACVLDFPTGG